MKFYIFANLLGFYQYDIFKALSQFEFVTCNMSLMFKRKSTHSPKTKQKLIVHIGGFIYIYFLNFFNFDKKIFFF